jgi:acetyl esterase/lipase
LAAASGAQLALAAVALRPLPVPATASPELQAIIARGASTTCCIHPSSAAQWKEVAHQRAEETMNGLPALRQKLGVSVERGSIAGVNVYTVTPREVSAHNRDRLLLNVHSGGYVFNAGEAGTTEAILVAGLGHIKVIEVDYRIPPDFPYPAALDDAMAVYRQVMRTHDPHKVAVFGTSTGGGMTLAMMLRAKQERLPLPAAIGAGSPWSDMTKTGDSYFTNEGVDIVMVRYDGVLGDAAKLYANGHDLKDPMLSPIYGDLSGFPPTFLTCGTRDLFLSNTVRVHRKLRNAGGVADLVVFEGMSHAQYLFSPDVPETQQYVAELTAFFDRYLQK